MTTTLGGMQLTYVHSSVTWPQLDRFVDAEPIVRTHRSSSSDCTVSTFQISSYRVVYQGDYRLRMRSYGYRLRIIFQDERDSAVYSTGLQGVTEWSCLILLVLRSLEVAKYSAALA